MNIKNVDSYILVVDYDKMNGFFDIILYQDDIIFKEVSEHVKQGNFLYNYTMEYDDKFVLRRKNLIKKIEIDTQELKKPYALLHSIDKFPKYEDYKDRIRDLLLADNLEFQRFKKLNKILK